LILLLTCAGCATVRIDDLAFSRVQALDRHEQAEVRPPGDMRATIAHMTGNPTLLGDPRIPGGERAGRQHELLLKVEFTSRTDFEEIPYRDNLAAEAFFCHRPDAHVLLGLWDVYSHGHEVPSGSVAGPLGAAAKVDKPITYYVFLRVARDERLPGKPQMESFDLRLDPEDVCFTLAGGRYRAFGYTSNIVVVPKDAISAALHAVPGSSDR
jgi:hypothetical protein